MIAIWTRYAYAQTTVHYEPYSLRAPFDVSVSLGVEDLTRKTAYLYFSKEWQKMLLNQQ